MKIRTGFVTNSSSTNFLIISKEELTADYLFEKLGFIKGGALAEEGMLLCAEIMKAVDEGCLYHGSNRTIDKNGIEEAFGPHSAAIYDSRKDHHTYWGNTEAYGYLLALFTTSCFEIDNKDFYINGKNCTW